MDNSHKKKFRIKNKNHGQTFPKKIPRSIFLFLKKKKEKNTFNSITKFRITTLPKKLKVKINPKIFKYHVQTQPTFRFLKKKKILKLKTNPKNFRYHILTQPTFSPKKKRKRKPCYFLQEFQISTTKITEGS